MEFNLTLVLGAGSSCAMGYPLGLGLKTAIIEESLSSNLELICDHSCGIFEDQLQEFIDEFQRSQQFSIDAFLAKRPDYAEIGKRAIAAALLTREDPEKLFKCDHEDHWYQYFLNHITSAPNWEELTLSKIAVITFNYDRSLEHYLEVALMHSYGKTKAQVHTKLAEMKIVHIYGVLGEVSGEKKYYRYGATPTIKQISDAAAKVRVIPEGRDDDPTLKDAREILKSSSAIGFLGFGFDEQNLNRLHSKETCRSVLRTDDGNITNRKVVATTFGMTKMQQKKAADMTRDAGSGVSTHLHSDYFIDCNCTKLLKETLILDKI